MSELYQKQPTRGDSYHVGVGVANDTNRWSLRGTGQFRISIDPTVAESPVSRIFIYLAILHHLASQALAEGHGPKFGPSVTQRMRVGLIVKAEQGACRGILATTPVPIDWPEQTVKVIEEQKSPLVKKMSYRLVDDTARQMVIEIPQLPASEEASAFVTFEITRHTLTPPEDTSVFVVPKKLDRQLKPYLTDSPAIESRHTRIRTLAKETAAGKQSAWETVEALYDAARAKVQYEEGPLKGGLKALEDGRGDCEDISSLFIALCRAAAIPARIVWVGQPSGGHCYPEFYLADAAGDGYWIPCQAAGDRAFGSMPELRPILQKGDDFRIPEHRQRQRYVSEFFLRRRCQGPAQRTLRSREPLAACGLACAATRPPRGNPAPHPRPRSAIRPGNPARGQRPLHRDSTCPTFP